MSKHMSHDVRKQPFRQNDVNVRNGGEEGKWYHMCYETNTTVLIVIHFFDEKTRFF